MDGAVAARKNPFRSTPPVTIERTGVAPDSPLVTTKLNRPPTPANTVGGERILAWADEISRRLLTLIRAPCGFGKTTAAAILAEHYALAATNRVGWVSFDVGDNDPDLGPLYIVDALRRMGIDELANRDDDLLAQSLSGNAVPLARVAVNALANRAESYFLFLDDFDRIVGDNCESFVNFLIVNAPANVHLILTCQAAPKLPLPYLRARDAVFETTTDGLRLSLYDTQKLLSSKGRLRKEQIGELHAAMEGWVTGIKLGAVALLNNGQALNEVGLVIEGAQWVSEYIEANIFNHLPPDVQILLLKCSIAERFSAPLAAHLSGFADAEDMIRALTEQNAFLEALDSTGEWYRLYPVFRKFLFKRLRLGGQDLDLHKAAAEFFVARGQPTDAIRHAIAADDFELALDCLESVAMGMVESSNITPLLEWIALIPPAAVKGRLQLSVARAWALALTGRREAVEVIDDIERHILAHPALNTVGLQADLAGIRSIHAVIVEDDAEAARELAMAYLHQAPERHSFASNAVRSIAAMCCTLAGDHVRARELLWPMHASRGGAAQTIIMAYGQYALAIGCGQQGHLTEARRLAFATLERCEAETGRLSGSAAVAAVLAARYAYESNQLRVANTILQGRFPIIDEMCFPDAMMSAYRMTVGIRAATHDLEGAAELIERAEAIARDRCWERLTATCAALRARMRLPQMIDLDALERRINWTLPLDAHPLAPAARMIQTVAEALIITKLDRNDLAGAARVVKQTLQVTSRSLLESIKIRMLQADLLQRSGRPDEAEAVVGDVIRRTAPHRALRCILDSTSIDVLTGFQETARWAALNDIEKAHLKAIQAARDVGAREVLHQVAARSANLFDLMTEREIDILRELAAGLSNKEIARRVQVTPETVKWHVRNLLRKLDAETRRDAVDKAVAMGLSVTS